MILRRFLLAIVVAIGWGLLVTELKLSSVLLVWGAGIIGLLSAIGLEPPRRKRFKFGGAPLAPTSPTVNLTGATKFSRADIPSGGEATRGSRGSTFAGRPSEDDRRIP